jgi:hypothetical protein
MKRVRRFLLSGLLLALGLGSWCCADTVPCTALVPYESDDGYQRWRDIASNLFIVGDSYTFYDSKFVQVCYETTAERFTGIVEGFGLKPFFAYQLKMEGKVPAVQDGQWDYHPDTNDLHWANEQLGYHGRWWRSVFSPSGTYLSGGNATDADYETMKKAGFVDTNGNIHVFSGYLLFDFAITNETGYLYREFVCDSTFHVLWRTSQGTPGLNDSAVRYQVVDPKLASSWYRRPPKATTVGVYAEWEQGGTTSEDDRPTPGALWLPEGTYPVQLRLTEESFHETSPSSGSWATVMVTDVSFTIGAPVPVRDAAVLGITSSASTVAPGETVRFDAEVANLGTEDGEEIEVTLTYPDDTSSTQTVSLAAGDSVMLSFVEWTAPAQPVLYVFTASARLVRAGDEDINLGNNSADVTVEVKEPVPPPSGLVVASYLLQARTAGANDYAVATVVVRDGEGLPVAGATVTIAWSGSITATQSGTTGTDGKVVLESPKKRNASSFTGTITNVTTATVSEWSVADGVANPQTVQAL